MNKLVKLLRDLKFEKTPMTYMNLNDIVETINFSLEEIQKIYKIFKRYKEHRIDNRYDVVKHYFYSNTFSILFKVYKLEDDYYHLYVEISDIITTRNRTSNLLVTHSVNKNFFGYKLDQLSELKLIVNTIMNNKYIIENI